jgi:uncharacterized protein YciI
MFVINLTYKVQVSRIDDEFAHILEQHRAWLDSMYNANKFLCSGPKNPRDGGVIIALGNDRLELESIIKDDPFHLNNIADYQIIEVMVNKKHIDLANIMI